MTRWPTGRLLSTAARLMENAWNSHLAAWDLNHSSFAVLWLVERRPVTQRDLAAHLQVQEQTVSRMLEKLQRLGYVDRVRSDVDRRKVLVTLTPKGLQARTEAQGAGHGEVERQFDRVLGADGTAALRAELQRLVSQLSQTPWA